MSFDSKKITWIVLIILGVVVASAVSGSVAGWVVAQKVVNERIDHGQGFDFLYGTSTMFSATDTNLGVQETSTIRLVPLSLLDTTPRSVPKTVFDRQTSVGILYARSTKADLMLTEDEVVSRAVAMTSDGWFAVPYDAIKASLKKDMVIWHDAELYTVESRILDTATNVVFLKVDASRLTVASFAQPFSNRTGVATWLEVGPMQFVPSAISSMRKSVYGAPRSSDVLSRRMIAIGQIEEFEVGAAMWDTNGSLVGIVEAGEGGRLEVIPGSAISASLQSLISNQKIEHASLGVMTMPTSLVRTLDTTIALPERGAWIYSDDKKIPAIIAGGAAKDAGLSEKDVILQVDRDIIDESVDLGDIVLQFVPGAEVTLRVLRSGEEIEVPVTLGTQVTSKKL